MAARIAAFATLAAALQLPAGRPAVRRPLYAAPPGPAVTLPGEELPTPASLALLDADGPPNEYDWDAHLNRIEADTAALITTEAAREAAAMAGDDEWVPEVGQLEALRADALIDDEPYFLKVRWDEVDPSLTDYRDMPPSRGSSWSKIRVKSAWPQFEDGERLRTEDGWTRFDQRAFNVTSNLIVPSTEFTYGELDLDVVAAIAPVLATLGNVARLLEAADGIVRIRYDGPAQQRVGMEAYATMLVREAYPELTSLKFEATFVCDYLDGGRETWEGMAPSFDSSTLGNGAGYIG